MADRGAPCRRNADEALALAVASGQTLRAAADNLPATFATNWRLLREARFPCGGQFARGQNAVDQPLRRSALLQCRQGEGTGPGRLAGLPDVSCPEPFTMMTFSCSRCGSLYRVKLDLAGKTIRCPGCSTKLRLINTSAKLRPFYLRSRN
jgi:DNA-directed RNA polymerase subunit RPC12/RpoP